VILLAVLPIHLFIQLQTEFPPPLIVALFVTNCSEAVLAAGGIWWLSDAPARIDTLRRLMVFFIAAVLLAPLISSFADAGVVTWFRGESYWRVWWTRLFSNTLAELIVVPAVVGGTLMVLRWRRTRLPVRWIEATVLALGVCATGWLAMTSPTEIPALSAASTQTPLALQLPFLLWAALRFGPTGTGMALLMTSVLSAWAVVHGVGPFTSIPAPTTITALQLSLILVAATLMCLATVIEERRHTQQDLGRRLDFEAVLSRLSAALVELPSEQMASAFEPWMGRIARVLGIDEITVFVASAGGEALQSVYSWTDDLVSGPPAATSEHHIRWARDSVVSRDSVLFRKPSTHGGSHKAGGAIPLLGEGQVIGALAFGSIGEPRWSNDLLANMRLVGEVLASALRRRQSEHALRESEEMKSAILQSLTTGVAVLDRTGRLLQANDRWRHFARGIDWIDRDIGANFLSNCWTVFERGDRLAGDVVAGVAAVLEGSRERFVAEHRVETVIGPEWWSLTAVPLDRPEGGAVITRANITELRRAEIEAQRSREELAHVARVSTVGELTASLAQQLNQPLSAMMTNAQAGIRMLDSQRPDFDEIRAILVDIAKDDRRASEVIQRVRELLRKGEFEMTDINISAAIREIVDLLSSEANIRTVVLSLKLEHDPLFVRGDRVQLQQVMLNLVHNAMEAMSDAAEGNRQIVVECRQANARVVVSVHDSGPGLPNGSEELVFEPFYTTKPGGMGMGLSIVRSIVEAHGGSIVAANHPDRGAIFKFFLPALN
jgi:signal transduction histidine kinase/integral membrane sensor domain MASE1